MHIISKILITIILVFEMFLWESRGPSVFTSFPADLFAPTKVMAANQGLYNGFLAAGLIWALLFIRDAAWKRNVALFFLSCVAVAYFLRSGTAGFSGYIELACFEIQKSKLRISARAPTRRHQTPSGVCVVAD